MNPEFNTNNVTPSETAPQNLPPTSYTPEPVKDKSSKRTAIILVILFILALIAAGVFAYLWQAQSKEASTQRTAVENAKTETSTAKAELAEAVKASETVAPATTTASSDDDVIIASAKAYLHGQVGYDPSQGDPNFSITKKSLPFAAVNLSSEHGGYSCVLKKADGIWFVILCLNGEPTQEVYNQWGDFRAVL